MSDNTVTISLPMPGSRGRWLAAGLAAGLVVAGLASPLFSAPRLLASNPTPTANEHTISVSGTGRVVLTPDTADLRLGVSVTAATVKAARADAATRMTAVIAALKKLGIGDKDIQTSFVTLQPTYDYSAGTNPPRLTGYQFGNGVAVTIRDFDKVGDAIDGALAAGATSLDSVSFRVADETAAADQARHAAMADGRRLDQRDGRPGPLPGLLRRRGQRGCEGRGDPDPGGHLRGVRVRHGRLPHRVAQRATSSSGAGALDPADMERPPARCGGPFVRSATPRSGAAV